jgi:hypothetical protein
VNSDWLSEEQREQDIKEHSLVLDILLSPMDKMSACGCEEPLEITIWA